METDPFSSSFVGTTGVISLSGLDIQPVTGTMFASGGFHNGGNLYELEQSGTASLVGPTGFDRVPGLTFDAAGTLFGSIADATLGEGLATINPGRGSGSFIGGFGSSLSIEGIAFHPVTGELYGSGVSGGVALFTIDTSSGSASVLGVLTEAGSGLQLPKRLVGLAFGQAGALYGSLGSGDGRIISIELTSLTFAYLGDASDRSISDIAVLPAVVRTYQSSFGRIKSLFGSNQ